jgi:hypothetical protein
MQNDNKEITIELTERSQARKLKDPTNPNIQHLEALIPFHEAVKLERGNANVRPPTDKKPMKMMSQTVEFAPTTFHVKNRGITYLCNKFDYDREKRTIKISVPELTQSAMKKSKVAKFGIADGGHTYEVIRRTVSNLEELQTKEGWSEPFVRVHFLAGEGEDTSEVENIVEALNTSLAVQQYTLDEYKHKFDNLKKALSRGGFDLNQIAFTENEDKEWNVVEIIQRLSCFLKDRWVKIQPTSMYKSKGKALRLFTDDETKREFEALYDIIADIITLPEYIQSEFSTGKLLKKRKLGKLRPVRTLDVPYSRPGTDMLTEHRMDLAALLPMASAFRELLAKNKEGKYYWKIDPKKVFREIADDLYDVLSIRSAKVKTASQLGSDVDYWATCTNIVMRAKARMLD